MPHAIRCLTLPAVVALLVLPAPVRAQEGAGLKTATLKLVIEASSPVWALEWVHIYVNGNRATVLKENGTTTVSVTGVPPGDVKLGFSLQRYTGMVKFPDQDVTVRVQGDDTLDVYYKCETTYNDFRVSRRAPAVAEMKAAPSDVKTLSVTFGAEPKRVVIKQLPTVRLARGISKSYSAGETVTHALTTELTTRTGTESKTGASAGAQLAIVSAQASIEKGIREEVERSTSTTLGTAREQQRSVTILGDGKTTFRVVWVKYYKVGTAKVRVDGKTVDVPFEIEDNFDIEAEEVPAPKAD